MLLDEIYAVCENKDELLAFMQYNGLLESEEKCEKCDIYCVIKTCRAKYNFYCEKCTKVTALAPKGFFFA